MPNNVVLPESSLSWKVVQRQISYLQVDGASPGWARARMKKGIECPSKENNSSSERERWQEPENKRESCA